MVRQNVFQDREIELIREGEIYTDGLMACFGIAGYFEKKGRAVVAMGHHSSLLVTDILIKWCHFTEQHPELQLYDTGRILVAKMNPEVRMPNQWRQADGRILTYLERINELIQSLEIHHPRADVRSVDYSPVGYFSAKLDDLTYQTNMSSGKLKPEPSRDKIDSFSQASMTLALSDVLPFVSEANRGGGWFSIDKEDPSRK